MGANGNRIAIPPVQPVAIIQIALLPDGNVTTQAQGAVSRYSINGMVESARQLLIQKIEEAEKGPTVQTAPPGLRFSDPH